MGVNIYGRDVLVIGDLHISDVYRGRHKNYLACCFKVMAQIEKKVMEEKPGLVIFAGDLIGVNEGNIAKREVLNMICKWLKRLNSVCPVYSVRGNHDFKGSFPDFQFLSELELIKTSADCDGYIDYYGFEGQAEPEVRFHLMDYGKENMPLNLSGSATTDIVVAHNNFTIQGLTNWYQEHDGIELAMQSNLDGVYMVISGHIHNPSPEIIATDMVSGGTCNLFYLGCPTRPSFEKNMYTSVWTLRFRYDGGTNSTDFSADEFPLDPIEDVFFVDDDFVEDKTEEELAEIERTEALKDVLDDIIKCRMTSGDIIGQVMCIPNASEEAKAMAVSYLEMAINNKKSS